MKAAEWIDRVKTAKKWESDYRAAKELVLSRNAISNYRVGARNTMDETTSIKVAHALGIDPAIILADQAMEMTKNDEARSAWSAILERLGGVAAGFLIAVGATAPAPAPAAQAQSTSAGLYIMSSRKRYQKRSTNRSIYPGWLPFFPQTRHA